jgi:hypothetical protein
MWVAQKMRDGDITSYMNQLFRTHAVVSDFKLRRDSTRWGVMERTVPTVYYVFVPPWVHARIVHPLRTRPNPSLYPSPDPDGAHRVLRVRAAVGARAHRASAAYAP